MLSRSVSRVSSFCAWKPLLLSSVDGDISTDRVAWRSGKSCYSFPREAGSRWPGGKSRKLKQSPSLLDYTCEQDFANNKRRVGSALCIFCWAVVFLLSMTTDVATLSVEKATLKKGLQKMYHVSTQRPSLLSLITARARVMCEENRSSLIHMPGFRMTSMSTVGEHACSAWKHPAETPLWVNKVSAPSNK